MKTGNFYLHIIEKFNHNNFPANVLIIVSNTSLLHYGQLKLIK